MGYIQFCDDLNNGAFMDRGAALGYVNILTKRKTNSNWF